MTIVPDAPQGNQLLRAAINYARRGWSVLALCPPDHRGMDERHCETCGKNQGKRPWHRWKALQQGPVAEEVIRQWWRQHPTSNVGLALGPVSGLVGIDVDGHEGERLLAELSGGDLPRTLEFQTGGGGRRLLYRIPEGAELRTTSDRGDGEHAELRMMALGSQTVLPPSVHPSGRTYEWKPGHSPEETQAAPAPAWLVARLRTHAPPTEREKPAGRTKITNESPALSPKGKILFTVEADRSADVRGRAVAYLDRCDPAVSEQGGHNQTFEVARAVVYGFDLGQEVGFDLIWHHYNPRCRPPWSEAELRHKCKEADIKPFDKPRGYLLNAGTSNGTPAVALPVAAASAEDIEALPIPQPAPWPCLPPEALHGLAGEIVRTIEPQTESDPVGILGQLLVAFGSAAGRGPYYPVEGDKHFPNLFLNTVGKSAHGRKGTAWGRVRQTMELADASWLGSCVRSGLASGEGLIHFVRDPVVKPDEDGVPQVVDEGVEDKRLLVVEGEFAQVLRVLKREGNTLSVFVRQAWDTGTLASLTRNSPLKATDAHVSIVGHITCQELAKYLDQTEMFNGFANRFLWLLVKRSKWLPDGGRELDLSPFGARLKYAIAAAGNVGAMTRDAGAGRLWHDEYPRLTAERTGLYGAVTGRAEAQVLRLSMVYALLDGKGVIEEAHLRAALALWSYADASARLIFGGESEDPLAALVLARLKEAGGAGMTRTELHNAFCRNVAAAKLLEALAALRDRGEAYPDRTKTGRPGAPAERWFAGKKPAGDDSFPSSAPQAAPEAEGKEGQAR